MLCNILFFFYYLNTKSTLLIFEKTVAEECKYKIDESRYINIFN
jgi:hypothetical protein